MWPPAPDDLLALLVAQGAKEARLPAGVADPADPGGDTGGEVADVLRRVIAAIYHLRDDVARPLLLLRLSLARRLARRLALDLALTPVTNMMSVIGGSLPRWSVHGAGYWRSL